MERLGRKSVFMGVTIFGVVMATVTTLTVLNQSFLAFCLAIFLIGATMAAVQQFRFAAMESVSEELIPKAASQVLLGGIVAAFIGPEIAVRAKDLFSQEYAGPFVILGVPYILAFLILSQYQNVGKQVTSTSEDQRNIVFHSFYWALVGISFLSVVQLYYLGCIKSVSVSKYRH